MEHRGAKYNQFGSIDCEINHATLGWIAFTATATDVDATGRQVFSDASAGATAFIPEPAAETLLKVRAGTSVPRYAFCKALAAAGILTQGGALQAAKGDWPSAMNGFLAFLTVDQAFDAELEWANAITINRMHPFVLSLGSYLSLTDVEVDLLFGIGG